MTSENTVQIDKGVSGTVLQILAKHSDLVLPIALLLIIGTLFIQVPSILLSVLILVNLGISILRGPSPQIPKAFTCMSLIPSRILEVFCRCMMERLSDTLLMAYFWVVFLLLGSRANLILCRPMKRGYVQ